MCSLLLFAFLPKDTPNPIANPSKSRNAKALMMRSLDLSIMTTFEGVDGMGEASTKFGGFTCWIGGDGETTEACTRISSG
jgi:hypothetical protein